jgi:hypothetical protein
MEVYDGSGWVSAVKTVVSFTTVGRYRWTAPAGINKVDVLLVGGGGGGGYCAGGGGGGGGFVEVPGYPVISGLSYPVVVGQGGMGQMAGDGSGNIPGEVFFRGRGGDSRFGDLLALGGGQGASRGATPSYYAGSNGGSGGGGHPCGTNSTPTNPLTGLTNGKGLQSLLPGLSGTYGYGFPGGGANVPGNVKPGGGGGGAGGAGASPGVQPGAKGGPGTAGQGGPGRSSSITGSSVTYAGGGGGGGSPGEGVPGALGGPGGAGNGGLNPNSTNSGSATAGLANTGGGGGGGTNDGPGFGPTGTTGHNYYQWGRSDSAPGGPGIVVIRY